MSRHSAIAIVIAVFGSMLVVSGGQTADAAAPTSSAERTSSCTPSKYKTKIRKVKGKQAIGLTRVRSKTYPGKTTISRHTKVKVSTDRVFKVSLGYTGSATVGASAMLKKVIGIYGKASGRTQFKTSFQSTKHESHYVSTDVKMVIPGGKSVAWFRGWRKVGGTFRASFCHHYSGMPTSVGIVEWHSGKFASYGYTSSGGQRCDLTAYEPVARAAKRAVCG